MPEVGTWAALRSGAVTDQTSREKKAALQVWTCRHDEVGNGVGVRGQGNKSISDEGPAKQRHG